MNKEEFSIQESNISEKKIVKHQPRKSHIKYKLKSGKLVPGTTTVLDKLGYGKGAITGWTVKQYKEGNDPAEVLKYLAYLGTLCHLKIQCHIENWTLDPYNISKEDWDYTDLSLKAFKKWEKRLNPTYIESERVIVSEKFQCGGTLDLVVRIDGQLTLADIKSASSVHEAHIAQIAAYEQYWNEVEDEPIENVIIIQVSRTTENLVIHSICKEKREIGLKMFRHGRSLYQLEKEYKKL